MKYRCFQNNRLVTNIYEGGQTISRVFNNGTLVWEREHEEPEAGKLVIYAKDGAKVTFTADEVSSIPFMDFMEETYKTNCLGYLSINMDESGDPLIVAKPYCDNEHLSTFKFILDESTDEVSVNSQPLSIIDNTNCLSAIPTYGFYICKSLEYIKSDSVKKIDMMSFTSEAM